MHLRPKEACRAGDVDDQSGPRAGRNHMHPLVEVRPVAASDADAVADVFLAALAEMTYLPELYTEEETRTFINEVLLPNNEVWVAIEDGGLVGFVGFGDGSLRHLWVLPRSQGQGVGTALLLLAMEHCPAGLRLSVYQKNVGARRLYERHGFQLTELRDGQDNEENEPDAVYVWKP